MKKPLSERTFTTSVSISIGEHLDSLSKHASSPSISDNDLVCNCGVAEIDTNMSYRYKDSQSQPSSLPRRYFSLPKNYSGSNTNNSKDSSHSTRYRSTSSSSTNSSTIPTSQSLRYGSLRTYGTSTNSSLTDDLKKPTSRRSGTSSLSSRPVGSSSIPRKSSYGSIKTGSTSATLRDSTPSYSARHVSTISNRNSGSSSPNTESNWIPGGVPIRQRSSITLRETERTWGPNNPPVRQLSSSSLRDSPFTLPTRRTRSSSQGINSDSETRPSSRKLSLETVSRRPISPSSVNYKDHGKSEESLKASPNRKISPVETASATSSPTVHYAGSHEVSASPTSPTVQYFGSLPRKDSPSSRSEASTTSGSQRESGSSGSQGALSDNGDELESSAARDISLLSREIASVYEGSLNRSDSKKGTTSNLVRKQELIAGNSSKESAKLEKQLSSENKLNSSGRSSQGQSSGGEEGVKFKKSHKRSVSAGSATAVKDENKVKPARKITGLFSRKKSRESTDSEDDEDRSQKQSSGLFSRKDSKDSVKGSPTRRGSSSSSHSPPVTPPKRKISGPGRLFSFSSDSKTTPELPKKFSVPGKYFTTKDAKSGEESSDLESESSRAPRPSLKRRVSLPGMLGLPRSASAERTSGGRRRSPEPSVDPALLQRRRSNFKKAQSFDVQNEKGKNSMLSKLKFWDQTKKDKSPDSRHSASPEEGRSRSTSPAVEPLADKNTTEEKPESKAQQSRKSRERAVRRKSSQEKEVPELKVTSDSIKPDTTSTMSGGEKLQVSPKVIHSSKEDDSVHKTVKEPKVHYVGLVEMPSPEGLRARKRAETSVDKDTGSTVNATEKLPHSKELPASNADRVQVKPLDAIDGSTRDTVLKLRERRRRRREERERFFAGLQPATNMTKEAAQKDHTLQSENDKNLKSDAIVEVIQDQVDGRSTTADNKLVEEKTRKVSNERNNHKEVARIPKISIVGKRSTVDDVEKGKMKNGKPRYKTIASSVHADIINDLIREKGLKTTTNTEVKIPSVAELRAKFLISKDDAKVTPPRPILKLEDRPHSICGGILSPTEMKKFEDITFSLAKKVSSDDIKMKKFSDGSSDSLPKLDTQLKPVSVANNEKSPPSSPSVMSSSKKEKKGDSVTNEENQVNEEQDFCPENDSLKRRRGSKKKRKKSLFGSDKDKEPKSPEEDVDVPQHGAVSSAIKAMFLRRPSATDKVKVSRKQRSKTLPGSPERDTIKSGTESRERKKSAPEYTVEPKTPDAQPERVNKKDAKDEKVVKTEEVKDLEKEKDIELQPIEDLEQKPVKERKSLKKRKYRFNYLIFRMRSALSSLAFKNKFSLLNVKHFL